jgi:hypothetical protein
MKMDTFGFQFLDGYFLIELHLYVGLAPEWLPNQFSFCHSYSKLIQISDIVSIAVLFSFEPFLPVETKI